MTALKTVFVAAMLVFAACSSKSTDGGKGTAAAAPAPAVPGGTGDAEILPPDVAIPVQTPSDAGVGGIGADARDLNDAAKNDAGPL